MTGALRSIADLVAEATSAAGATSAKVAEERLSEAAAQATDHRDWEKILAAFPQLAAPLPRERHLAFVERARTSARDRREIWGYHHVALHQAHVLGDPRAARATLEEGRAMLLDLDRDGEALGFHWGWLAAAFHGALGDESEVRAALERGWEIAWRDEDVENLGRLAWRWSELVSREESLARFQRVEDAARSWNELAATVYWWSALGDSAAAARVREEVGETATPPERVPEATGDVAEDASALFDWLRARVTRSQLESIAAADYGDDQAEHLAALEGIVASGLVPPRLGWHPGEVIELTRWSTEDVDHLARAFCCVVLCLGNPDDELANTAAPLVDSCLHLGEEACVAGERLLAWLHERARKNEVTAEALVASFAVVLLAAARNSDDSRVAGILRDLAASPDIAGLRETLATSVSAQRWSALVDRWISPLHATHPKLSPLLAAIGFPP